MEQVLPRINETLDFDPEQPTVWSPEPHRDVILVPWGEKEPGGARRAAGLFDRSGRFMPAGHCWRYAAEPITVPPVPPTDISKVERLAGRWLFGGLFYGHFGHFLVETTSRLWALDGLADVDGIVFFPKQRLTHEHRQFRHLLPFFNATGLAHLQIRAPQAPIIVDELIVPPPGFGMGDMIEGRLEYRRWMRTRLTSRIAPIGAEDIYVSRTRLTAKRGSILLEDHLETLMAAEGYTIFHPQDEPFEDQVAAWQAARRIVSLDGSALHLAAMVAGPATRVAIINRGPSANIFDYVRQFRRFSGIDPVTIEAIKGYYHPAGRRVVKRETYATLDFPTVGRRLAEGRFVTSDRAWTAAAPGKLDAAAAEVEAGLNVPLAYYPNTGAA